MMVMDRAQIEALLKKLGNIYADLDGPDLTISVCGGAALTVAGLIDRTTKDIDLIAPPQLPQQFFHAAKIVADELGLPSDWINQGPKQLAEMGLPDGFDKRSIKKRYSPKLTAQFASRLDQIFFKTYAAVDRGGYHFDDLKKLNPTSEELGEAARWCMTHDVSQGFKEMLQKMLKEMSHEDVAESI